MKLNVLERAVALGIFPEKEDFSTLRTIQDARSKLALSEDEVKNFDFKALDDGKMQWNTKGNEDKDVELSEAAIEILKKKLREMDEKKELTPNHVSLFEKIAK